MFDVIAYLESKGIQYWLSGKNVAAGWISLQCPYCGDTSNHLGVCLSTGLHSCWSCGKKGGPEKLIMYLEHCSYGQAVHIAREFYDDYKIYIKPQTKKFTGSFQLPKTATTILPAVHKKYLIRRGFDPDQLQCDYDIRACHTVGLYRYRIIIPIYAEGELVNFVARDITEKFTRRYLMPPANQTPMRRDHLLYNIDQVRDNVAIVEGTTDVWRIGKGAVATFGTRVTEDQINMLVRRKIKRAFVIFDRDAAMEYGQKLAEKLAHFIPHVENIRISEGDPDEYFLDNPEDLRSLQFLLR